MAEESAFKTSVIAQAVTTHAGAASRMRLLSADFSLLAVLADAMVQSLRAFKTRKPSPCRP